MARRRGRDSVLEPRSLCLAQMGQSVLPDPTEGCKGHRDTAHAAGRATAVGWAQQKPLSKPSWRTRTPFPCVDGTLACFNGALGIPRCCPGCPCRGKCPRLSWQPPAPAEATALHTHGLGEGARLTGLPPTHERTQGDEGLRAQPLRSRRVAAMQAQARKALRIAHCGSAGRRGSWHRGADDT